MKRFSSAMGGQVGFPSIYIDPSSELYSSALYVDTRSEIVNSTIDEVHLQICLGVESSIMDYYDKMQSYI